MIYKPIKALDAATYFPGSLEIPFLYSVVNICVHTLKEPLRHYNQSHCIKILWRAISITVIYNMKIWTGKELKFQKTLYETKLYLPYLEHNVCAFLVILNLFLFLVSYDSGIWVSQRETSGSMNDKNRPIFSLQCLYEAILQC